MNIELLKEIGLTESQAKAYIFLIQKGEITPPKLAELIGETRTNTYMVLDKLEELGLAEKVESAKKIAYRPINPVALEELTTGRRKRLSEAEQLVKRSMPQLLSYFYSFTEKPGVRLLQGVDGLKEVYADILRTRDKLYLIRSVKDKDVLGHEFMDQYIAKRVKLGIEVEALTPEHESANREPNVDKAWLMERHWIERGVYEEPVEIDVYGDKIAFIAYGTEVMAVIIQSPSMAKAFRTLFGMMAGSS